MPHSVFISYARGASASHAQALAGRLEGQAFLDTEAIDDGDHFPQRLLDALLAARVVVIFASQTYLERRFCRVEMRLALYGGNENASHLVLAMGDGPRAVRDAMPQNVADTNWPPAGETDRLATLVLARLAQHTRPLSSRIPAQEARVIASVFLEEASIPEPRSLQGILVSFPPGLAAQSIGRRFVGRAADIRTLHQTLAEGSGGAARLTSRITAGAGFGKTRLAIEYVYRYGPQYYPGGIFWVNAASAVLDEEFWRILRACDPTTPDIAIMREQRPTIRERLESTLRAIPRPVLYVADNIPEAEPGQPPPALEHFCPALGAVTVLATSRQDTREQGVESIAVDTLNRNSAILLLRKDVPSAGTITWEDWGRIADWVGDLPIALDLLNRSLALDSISARQLLARATAVKPSSTTAELKRLGAALSGQIPQQALAGVTEAFSISYEKLDTSAQTVARILAQLGPTPIPEEFLEALPEKLNVPSSRAALRSRHFVTSSDSETFGVMHRLTADFLRSLPQGSRPTAFESAGKIVEAVMTPDRCRNPHDWPLMNLCRPHAEALFIRGQESDDTAVAASNFGLLAAFLTYARGDYPHTRELEERVLAVSRRVQGAEHADTLLAMNNLAETIRAQGDLPAARELQERVLAIRREVLGEEDPDTLTSMGNLAETLRAQGELPEARNLQERVLEVCERTQGPEHPDTLRALNNLAESLRFQGDLAEARKLHERVFEVCVRLQGDEHPDTLITMCNLAETLRSQGDFPEARKLQERVLEASERTQGAEHPDTLRALNNLAETVRAQGDFLQARKLQEHLIEVWMRIHGEKHPNTLTALNNLGFTLWVQGDFAAARKLQERLLVLSRQVFGEEHPGTLRAMNNLAETLRVQGELIEARRLQEIVREISERTLGPEHPSTFLSLNNLSLILLAQGELPEARQLLEGVLDICLRTMGAEHPDTLRSMNNLALVLRGQGDLAGARILQEHVMNVWERLLGEEHPDSLTAMGNLALTISELGDLPAAQQLNERVLGLQERVLGEEHPNTLTSMSNLAATLYASGNLQDSLFLFRKCLALRRRALGENHPDTIVAAENVAYVESRLEPPADALPS